MSGHRRYSEEEVRQIFELASRHELAEVRPAGAAEGMTLAAIQEIGEEVGIEPTAVARAAAALDGRVLVVPPARTLGMPVGVGRVVPLPRPLTDGEWDRLVAELRATFGARGRVSAVGELREWYNGNLHASVEPSPEGWRLRLGTRKGDATALNAFGVVGVATGAITLGSVLLSGAGMEAIGGPLILGASGAAAFVANLLRLPPWARRRERQMEHLAARLPAILQQGPPEAEPGGR